MSCFSTSSVYYLWIRLLKPTVYLCPPSYLHLNQARFNSFWIISVILMSVLFTEENCSNKIKQAVFFQWFSQLSVIILLLQIEMMKKNCKNSYTKPEVFEGIKKTWNKHSIFGAPCRKRWAGWLLDRAQALVLSWGYMLVGNREDHGSQMGVSFPAIQGGRDLRPPLRAPIWCLIPRKYRQVSTPFQPLPSLFLHLTIHPSIQPRFSSQAEKPHKFKASVRARANPMVAFPRARADEILFFARKNYRGRGGKEKQKIK